MSYLDTLPVPDTLTTKQVADLLGWSEGALRKRRRNRQAPEFIKKGGRYFYPTPAVKDFVVMIASRDTLKDHLRKALT